MRAGSGKAKGSSFERVICKDLSLWVSGGARDDLYWRSAMSGGRATVAKKKGKSLAHVSGDICAVHPDGAVLTDRYFVECKHYKDLAYRAFLLSGSGAIATFWDKVREQAHSHGKQPLLILKQNQCPTVVLINQCRDEPSSIAELHWHNSTMLSMELMLATPFNQFGKTRKVVRL